MNISTLIARRYLFSKKRVTLVSALTIISISGVTLGTALLIIVLSVFNGFFDLVKSMMRAQDPDIRIESATGRDLLLDEEQLNAIKAMDEITVVSPYVEGKAIVTRPDGQYSVAIVRGIEPEIFPAFFELETYFEGRPFDFSLQQGRPGVLLSRNQMNDLGLESGEDLRLLSAQSIQRSLTHFSGPRVFQFEVRGYYNLTQQNQQSVLYMDKRAAQRLFNLRNVISGVDILLTDHMKAEELQPELRQLLGEEVQVKTWYDLQKPLYDVMNLEKWGAYIILTMIVLVAVLNIIGSLTMIVIQKTRDIAMLRSMGFTIADIRRVFLKQGFMIGLIGCGLGGSAGLLLTWMQEKFGLVKLAGSESFIINAYPVQLLFTDVALVLSVSLVLCLLASWYPAARASKVEISSALRYE
jgi:lipoprotein-releasing system permease protein